MEIDDTVGLRGGDLYKRFVELLLPRVPVQPYVSSNDVALRCYTVNRVSIGDIGGEGIGVTIALISAFSKAPGQTRQAGYLRDATTPVAFCS